MVEPAGWRAERPGRRPRIGVGGGSCWGRPPVRNLRRQVESDELGRIYCADAARLSLCMLQRDRNVVWDLAPHDVSILMHVLGEYPVQVSARGSACIQRDVPDVCYLELIFPDRIANLHVSWLDPDRVRRLTLVGDRRMAVYNDASTSEKLRIYDRGVECPAVANYGEYELAYRHGPIEIPHLQWRQPLPLHCEDFPHSLPPPTRPPTARHHG